MNMSLNWQVRREDPLFSQLKSFLIVTHIDIMIAPYLTKEVIGCLHGDFLHRMLLTAATDTLSEVHHLC